MMLNVTFSFLKPNITVFLNDIFIVENW